MINSQAKNTAEAQVLAPGAALSADQIRQDDSVGWATVVEDFGKSFVQSALVNPVWNGVGQLVSLGHLPLVSIDNPENAKKSEADSWGQKIGSALGMAADFYVLHKLKVLAFGEAMSAQKLKSLPTLQRSLFQAKESAKLGAVYGAVFSPSDPNGNLFLGRVANAGSEALTFGVLGGGVQAMSGLKTFGKIQPGSLANVVSDMGIAGIAGLPAGAVGVVAHSTFAGRPVTIADVKEAALDYSIIGFTLAGITHGAGMFRPGQFSKTFETGAPPLESSGKSASRNVLGLSNLSQGIVSFPPLVSFKETTGSFRSSKDYGQNSFRKSDNIELAELEQKIKEVKDSMAKLELPVSSKSDQSTWRFIPEKATALEAAELGFERSETAVEGTQRGDKILEIKRYINSTGQPAREYLAKVIKDSDMTIIGEHHTIDAPNSHRLLGTELIGELPRGSILAVEMPASLKPIFEEFNNAQPGTDLNISSRFSDMVSMQPSLRVLNAIKSNAHELIDMWKIARDKGVRVEPIDAEPIREAGLTSENRESFLANQLIDLYRHRDSKPVIAWIGAVHAARNTESGIALLAKRISESPEFADGKGKLDTVYAQLTEIEAERLPMHVLSSQVKEAIGMPTRQNGKESPIGSLPIFDKFTAETVRANLKASDYDHVIMYPRSSLEAQAKFFTRRVDSLFPDVKVVGKKNSPESGEYSFDWDSVMSPKKRQELWSSKPCLPTPEGYRQFLE